MYYNFIRDISRFIDDSCRRMLGLPQKPPNVPNTLTKTKTASAINAVKICRIRAATKLSL